MWSSIPKKLKALVGAIYDETALKDELARNGIRHYRVRKDYMEGMTRHVSTTDFYLTEHVKKNFSLRRSFRKALSPEMTPEQARATLNEMIGDFDTRMKRWQEGRLTLSDRFYVKVEEINLPRRAKGRNPRQIICFALDGNDRIKSVAYEPFPKNGSFSSFRR
jgi:hypothetical protein